MPKSLLRGFRIHPANPVHRGHAFTLIELLVVISVVALLIALLLPVLTNVKRVGKQLRCAVTVRSWTQAVLTYSVDMKEQLPSRGPGLIATYYPNTTGTNFFKLIKEYGLDRNYCYCPESAIPEQYQQAMFDYDGTLSYTYYPYLPTGPAAVPRSPSKTLDTTDQFGGMSLLFADVNRFTGGPTPLHTNHADPGQPIIPVLTELGFFVFPGMPRGINNSYIDGHVVWIPFAELTQTLYYSPPYGDQSYHWKS